MILELDCGNSLIKWRLLDSSLTVVPRGKADGLDELVVALRSFGQVDLVRVCSVRDAAFATKLQSLLEQFSAKQQWAHSQRELAGVVNGYPDYQRLGVDRWLALVAAFNRSRKACVIIDCGTALTVDFVDAQGQHLGGAIAPGLGLLRRSLLGATALKVSSTSREAKLSIATNTEDAVAKGIEAMAYGFVREQLANAAALLAVDYQVYFTGGDARLLAQACPNALVEDELVFEGLAHIQAEQK